MVGRKASMTAIAVISTVALVMGPATAASTMRGRYLTPLPTGTSNPSTGGVHFDVPSGTGSMDVTVKDRFIDAVAFRVEFVIHEYFDIRYSPWFCSSVRNLQVPDGTKALDVRVDGGFSRCKPPGIATNGTIYVTFR